MHLVDPIKGVYTLDGKSNHNIVIYTSVYKIHSYASHYSVFRSFDIFSLLWSIYLTGLIFKYL